MSAHAFDSDPAPPPAGGRGDEAASVRPAPRARSGEEIRLSLDAIMQLARCGDRRAEALGKGGYFAARWASGQEAHAPASGIHRPLPNFREIAAEIETAGRAAAGAQTFPGASWCDEGRLAARGVEEWLAWTFVQRYRTPLWLVADMPLGEIRSWVLGSVGLGTPGLLGPGVSKEPFPYDVADVLTTRTSA